MDYTRDVRLEHDHIVREEWTHEQVGGAAGSYGTAGQEEVC
jgi:hypothetical protein